MSINIKTHKPSYMGGETITGNIEVYSSSHLMCQSVKLTVSGKEKCKFHVLKMKTEQQSDGSYEIKYEREKVKDDREFFDRDEKSLWSGVLPPEPQLLPFEFALPRNLPASFHMKGSSGSGDRKRKWEACISYKVKAKIVVSGGSDLVAKQSLVIVEPPHAPTEPIKDYKEGSALCCLCIPRGKIRIEAHFDRLQVFPGERFGFHLIVDNDSSMNVNSTKTKLMRVIELKAKGKSWRIVDQIGPTGKFNAVPGKSKLEQDVYLDIDSSVQPATTYGSFVSCKFHMDAECDIAWAPDVELHRSVDICPHIPKEWGSQYYVSTRHNPNVSFLATSE